MHKIIGIALVDPDEVEWSCECGASDQCPRPIAAQEMAQHLAGGDS